MSSPYTSFDAHLGTLPPESARHGAPLREAVAAAALASTDDALMHFVFLPDRPNPHYEDADLVFAQAVEAIGLRKPLLDGEIPLLYVGYHIMSRLGGARAPQGLLLTDQALYAQDDFSVLLETPLPRPHALPQRADDAPPLVAQLLSRYKAWKDWARLAEQPQDALQARIQAVLAPAVQAVAAHHAQHGSQRHVEVRRTTLAEFTTDRGLADNLLDPANLKLAKKLGKVVDKFQLPAGETLRWALVEIPLFGGPYGLALSAQALYGKDLMEAPLRVPLAQLDAQSLRLDEKEKSLTCNTGQVLTLPAHVESAHKRPFIDFLKQEITDLQSTS